MTQLKRETLRYQHVVGAVREPPAPEHWPFSYRTAFVLSLTKVQIGLRGDIQLATCKATTIP